MADHVMSATLAGLLVGTWWFVYFALVLWRG